jgi:hypothetical protein
MICVNVPFHLVLASNMFRICRCDIAPYCLSLICDVSLLSLHTHISYGLSSIQAILSLTTGIDCQTMPKQRALIVTWYFTEMVAARLHFSSAFLCV